MLCRHCGAHADEGDLFCANCGMPLEDAASDDGAAPSFPVGAPPAAGTAKKPPSRRLLLLSGLGALAVLAAALIVFLLLRAPGASEKGFTPLSPDCLLVLGGSSDDSMPIYAGTKLAATLHDPALLDYALDFESMLCVDGRGDLLWVSAHGPKLLASGVSSAVLSDSGETAAYQDETGAAYLIEVSTGKLTTLPDGLSALPALSPSGLSWAYSAPAAGDGGQHMLLLLSVKGGKPVEVCTRGLPLALTDDGLLYYLLADGTTYQFDLYTYQNGTSTLIAKGVDSDNDFSFTRDHRELLFKSGGASYWLRDGGELAALGESGQFFPLSPPGSFARRDSSAISRTYSVGSFADKVLYTLTGGLYYLDENGVCRTLAEETTSGDCTLSADGNSLLYTVWGDGLYLLPDLQSGEPPQFLAEMKTTYNYSASSDLSTVYFMDAFGGGSTLYTPGPGGSAVPVAENVTSYTVSLYSGALYYITGGKLYCVPTEESAPQAVDLPGTQDSLGYTSGSRALCSGSEDGSYRYYCEESAGVFVPVLDRSESE